MLAGLMFLQAFAILGQGIFLARAIVGSWKRQSFANIAEDVLTFLIFYLLRQGINWFQKWYMNRYANQTTALLRQQLLNKTYDGYIKLQNHFVDALRGLSTLKVLGLAKKYGNIVYKNSENYRKKTMGVLRVAILSTFTLDFFTTLSIAIIAMFLGIGLINGNLVLYPSLVILILSPEYFLPKIGR